VTDTIDYTEAVAIAMDHKQRKAQREVQMATEVLQDPRVDPRLDDPTFIATDEGQALLAELAQADKDARKAARKAELAEKRAAAIARDADAEACLLYT
jgi:hypothetical protein